jgi:hypothetical protein
MHAHDIMFYLNPVAALICTSVNKYFNMLSYMRWGPHQVSEALLCVSNVKCHES